MSQNDSIIKNLSVKVSETFTSSVQGHKSNSNYKNDISRTIRQDNGTGISQESKKSKLSKFYNQLR